MQRLIAAVVALTLFLSAGPVALAAEAAGAPLEQAPDIKPFNSAHFAMAGTVENPQPVKTIAVEPQVQTQPQPPVETQSQIAFQPPADQAQTPIQPTSPPADCLRTCLAVADQKSSPETSRPEDPPAWLTA